MLKDIIQRMIEAGTPADIIADVAMELAAAKAAGAAIEGRRAADRERKASQRAREAVEVTGSHVTARDSEETTPSPPNGPPKEISNPPLNPPLPHQSIELRARGSKPKRLDPAWRPSDLTGHAAAAVEKWPAGELERELERFRNHWAGSGMPNAKKCDWQAAWANWVLKAEDEAPKGRRGPEGVKARGSGMIELGDGFDEFCKAAPEKVRGTLRACEFAADARQLVIFAPSPWHFDEVIGHKSWLDLAAAELGHKSVNVAIRKPTSRQTAGS